MSELAQPNAAPNGPPADLSQVVEELRAVKALLLEGAVPLGYLSLEQAATYLNRPVGTLRTWVRLKGLPYHKPGKDLQFRVRELDLWMDRYQRGLKRGELVRMAQVGRRV